MDILPCTAHPETVNPYRYQKAAADYPVDCRFRIIHLLALHIPYLQCFINFMCCKTQQFCCHILPQHFSFPPAVSIWNICGRGKDTDMRKSKLQQLRLYVYPIYTILCIYLLLSYKTKKKRWYRALLCLSWCRRRDLNSHAIARTAAWRQRVCRSTTPTCFLQRRLF